MHQLLGSAKTLVTHCHLMRPLSLSLASDLSGMTGLLQLRADIGVTAPPPSTSSARGDPSLNPRQKVPEGSAALPSASRAEVNAATGTRSRLVSSISATTESSGGPSPDRAPLLTGEMHSKRRELHIVSSSNFLHQASGPRSPLQPLMNCPRMRPCMTL